jgi:site-specific recombinase XerC
MASLYKRKGRSPFFWIRYKQDGAWKSKATAFRIDNPGEQKQAQLLAQRMTLEERLRQPINIGVGHWENWVDAWLESRWTNKATTTSNRYRRHLRRLLAFFDEIGVKTPSGLKREHIDRYFAWRKKRKGNRNTAIHELKFAKQLMDEAVTRGYASKNPVAGLRYRKEPAAEKSVWTAEEMALVETVLEREQWGKWLHVSFLLGRYQAARLRQCQVPLSAIDLEHGTITYPAIVVKGGKSFSQPIDPDFLPKLKELVKSRKAGLDAELCVIPGDEGVPPSVQWRELLDSLGLLHLSHHGLRVTWITAAARAGINEQSAMRFCHHASESVHAIYTKLQADDLAPMLQRLADQRKGIQPNV